MKLSRKKKYLAVIGCTTTLILATAGLSRAQAPNPISSPTTTEDPSPESYRIGVSDVLDIKVTTGSGVSPQLSAENVQVNERGQIVVFDGSVSASCLTPNELSANLRTRYLRYKREPLNVMVNVREYRSQQVAVIGAVKAPGRFELRRPIRLLELLALYANGLDDKSDGRIEVVHTHTEMCNGAVNTANPSELISASYKWDDLRIGKDGNVYVRPGDVISVSEAPQAFVIGNVRDPRSIPLKEKTTLTTAIAMAGGTLEATKGDSVRIERQKGDGGGAKDVLIVDLNAIKKRQAADVVLQPGDIVDVPASTGGKILRGLLGSIAPTITQSTVRVIR